VVIGVLALAACAGGPPRPAPLDTRNEACAWCRMVVSDPGYAAQIVAPGEEPLFFDDVACMAHFLRGRARPGAAPFVADRRTRAWVPAGAAVYTKVAGLQTPMGSGLVAHADRTSRDADRTAAGGSPVTVAEVFGSSMVPGAAR
jgi:copper chaperone NosL